MFEARTFWRIQLSEVSKNIRKAIPDFEQLNTFALESAGSSILETNAL